MSTTTQPGSEQPLYRTGREGERFDWEGSERDRRWRREVDHLAEEIDRVVGGLCRTDTLTATTDEDRFTLAKRLIEFGYPDDWHQAFVDVETMECELTQRETQREKRAFAPSGYQGPESPF